jgi:nucleotide-binding universal stress UspA family protein
MDASASEKRPRALRVFPQLSLRVLACLADSPDGLALASNVPRKAMEDRVISIKVILVATDFSEPSATALRYGRDLARTHRASFHLLHVADDIGARLLTAPLSMPPDVGHLQTKLEEDARQAISAQLTAEDRDGLQAQAIVLTSTRPADAILSYARDFKADLIVMGTHGRTGMAHLLMGSVAEHVVRAAPCPVLTVRHPEREFVQPDALQIVAPRAQGEPNAVRTP